MQAHQSFGRLQDACEGTRGTDGTTSSSEGIPKTEEPGTVSWARGEREEQGFFPEKETGVRRWRARAETLPPGSLFSFSFFFLMERVKLFLKWIHHEYLLLVQVLSWL